MSMIHELDSDSARARFLAVARDWFHDDSAAGPIVGVLRLVAEFHGAEKTRGTPAQRSRKADSIRQAAIKLDRHIASLDLETQLDLFARIRGLSVELETAVGMQLFGMDQTKNSARTTSDSRLTASAQAANTDAAINRLVEFAVLIEGLKLHADSIVKETPNQTAGAPKTADPIMFGVESLAAIWRRYRLDPPTSSGKKDGFGLLALSLLTEGPVSATEKEVKTAVRRHFERKKK
jgi:hypothetical protein